jgi:hypothetical protein
MYCDPVDPQVHVQGPDDNLPEPLGKVMRCAAMNSLLMLTDYFTCGGAEENRRFDNSDG